MHFEIRHLRLVRAIADTASVTRASERLHLTQSAVSHQLLELEGRLGTPLFVRTGKRMVLSAAGERIYHLAGDILASLHLAEREILRDAGEGPTGIVRIATECYTCYHWLPPVLKQFRSQHERVEVRVVPEATRRTMRALLAGKIDVAIVSHVPRTPRIRSVSLFEDEIVAVMPPDHPLATRQFLRAEDFSGEALVVYNMPDEHSTLLHDILRPARVRPGPITRVQLTEGIVELVRAGFGITTMARWAAAPQLASKSLVAVPLGRGGFRRVWHAAVRSRDLRGYVASFLDAIANTSFAVAPLVPLQRPVRRRSA